MPRAGWVVFWPSVKWERTAKKPDSESLIRLHILTSSISGPYFPQGQFDENLKDTVEATGVWANKAVDEMPYSPWAIPAFVRGINISAEFNLGFTEPFSRLS